MQLQSWTDQGLVWPSEDPDHVTIHPSKIWKPDTVLFNRYTLFIVFIEYYKLVLTCFKNN